MAYFPRFLYFRSLFHEPSGGKYLPYCTRHYGITNTYFYIFRYVMVVTVMRTSLKTSCPRCWIVEFPKKQWTRFWLRIRSVGWAGKSWLIGESLPGITFWPGTITRLWKQRMQHICLWIEPFSENLLHKLLHFHILTKTVCL